MCTVSLIARKQGYLLGMNRDEKLTRVAGLPPKIRRANQRTLLCPSEPGGGTWIAVNDSGATLALINWYSIPANASSYAVSRGEIVRTVGNAGSAVEVDSKLRELPLERIQPFRLIGIFPHQREVIEWQWNLKKLIRQKHPWRTQQWISSGFDEPKAQRLRGQSFRRAQQQKSVGSLDWLRRLHRSHPPGRGPFSTCMHRSDAATVSYTEIIVSSRNATMRHLGSAPCQCHRRKMRSHRLRLEARAYCPKTR